MRTVIILLFTSVFISVAETGYTQNAKVTLNKNKVALKEVLNEIENQTDYLFIYNNKVNTEKTVSVNTDNNSVREVLTHVLKGSDIDFLMEGNHIILSYIEEKREEEKTKGVVEAVVQQGKTVAGRVTDTYEESLPGVTVIVKGTTKGTTTDVDGNFNLTGVPENATLQFSFVGMKMQEIPIGNQTRFDVVMEEEMIGLEEIVAIGYGTQKKVNLTGAVELLKGEELENRATTTVSQALQGKISGITFTPGVYGQEPGVALDIMIRGQGSPLILVDGVPGSLNGLNPNDIESISVLKDAAAAAIYGAKAPYGVVLITTKSGKMGDKLNIEFTSSVSRIRPVSRMPHHVDSYTWALAMNEAGTNAGTPNQFSRETIDRIIAYQADPINTPETVPNPSNPSVWATVTTSNANYDWFDVYYGEGLRNQENLAVSGGSDAISYYVSAGHVYDEGILQVAKDDYRRYNTTAKFVANLTKWFKISSNTRFYNTIRERPAFDKQGGYDLLFHQLARTRPNQYMISPNGVYSVQSKIPWTRDAGSDKWNTNDIINSFNLEITPLEDWTINADYSLRLNHEELTSNNYTVYEDRVDGSLLYQELRSLHM